MNFQDYKWFKNPRGLHNNGPYSPLNTTRYTGPRMGWAKLVVGGTEQVETAQYLVGQGCMPIVRIFRERMGSMVALDTWYDIYQQYFDAGCRWFELYDEPNLETSWAPMPGRAAITVDWSNVEWCVKPLMDNWLGWAERIIDMGGYPAFPALAETTEPRQATMAWLETCLKYLQESQSARFVRVLTNGLWCATHPYLLNHFYQEPPGGPGYVARPYYQQSAAESGWHFEYPYDPLQQRDDPGRTIFGGTTRTPQGDPNGLVATGQAFQELLKRIFDAGPVPVVGTAGGIGPIPGPNDEPVQIDKRYPPFSRDSHAEATLAMWRWIAHQGPPWLFGLTLSTEADYYDRQGASPAIELMLTEQPVLKEVPDLEITSGITIEEKPRLIQLEPTAQPVPVVEAMPEPLLGEEPDLATQPEEAAVSPAPPPGDTTQEVMLFEDPDSQKTPPTEVMAPPPEEAGFEPILFEEARMGPELPPLEAIAPPLEEAEAEPILFEEPEAEPELPPLEAVAPPPGGELVFDGPEPDDEAPLLETFAPLPPELADSEPSVTEGPRPMPETPWFETVTDLPTEESEKSATESASEPLRFEEPMFEEPGFVSDASKLEPIPFEDFDTGEPLPDVPTIEAMLPELAWDDGEPPALPVPADVSPAAGPSPDKVLPQLLQDAASVDDLLPGPPPEKLDYHFLMIAPDLPSEWLFQAALRYWQTFRPALLPQPELVGLLPAGKSIAVTLLATRSTVREAHRCIHDQWPDVYIDPAICENQEAMREEMDRRAAQEQRFGH